MDWALRYVWQGCEGALRTSWREMVRWVSMRLSDDCVNTAVWRCLRIAPSLKASICGRHMRALERFGIWVGRDGV